MAVDTRYFGIKPEQTYGTFEAPTFYIDTTSANIRKENTASELEDLSRDTSRRHGVGRFVASGSVEGALDAITCGYFLYGLMGSVKSTKVGTTYAYQHLFPDNSSVVPVATLPSFSMIIGMGPDQVQEDRYNGMGMSRGSINADATVNNGVRISVDVTGNMEDIDATLADPTFDDLPIFEFVHGALQLEQGALPCHRITIDTANAISEDYLVLGSRNLYALYKERRTITVTYEDRKSVV